jgi:BTG family
LGSKRLLLKSEISRQLRKRFEGHWFPKDSEKDSNLRIIRFDGKLDPIFEEACKKVNICTQWIHWNFMDKLTIWINPSSVLIKMGSTDLIINLFTLDRKFFTNPIHINIVDALSKFLIWRGKRASRLKIKKD